MIKFCELNLHRSKLTSQYVCGNFGIPFKKMQELLILFSQINLKIYSNYRHFYLIPKK